MNFDDVAVQGESTIMTGGSGSKQEAATYKPPQAEIEKRMAEIVRRGNYETAHLFSDEGLPIAQSHETMGHPVDHDRITEIAILLQDVRRMASLMGNISKLREITIEGENRRKIVFRFFHSFGQSVILAVVVPPNTAYRQRTNELEKLIVRESF